MKSFIALVLLSGLTISGYGRDPVQNSSGTVLADNSHSPSTMEIPASAATTLSGQNSPNAPIPSLTETLVARPAAAAEVTWPDFPVKGRDFWMMMGPKWHELEGIRDEAFVQNAGLSLPNLYYTNRGVLRGDLRKTKIREIEIFCGDKNIAGGLTFTFSSEETDTLFYDMEKVQDENQRTSAYIIGNSADFRRRNDAVPYQIQISGINALVDSITLRTDVHGCAPFATVEVRDESGRIQTTVCERSPDDAEWNLRFLSPFAGKSLILRGQTAASLYSLTGIQPQYRELAKKVPFMTKNFFFRGSIAQLKKENVDRASIRKMHAEYPETFIGQLLGEPAANYFQKRTRPARFRDQLTEQGFFVPLFDRDRYDAEDGLKNYWRRHIEFFGELCALPGGLMTAPWFYEWGSPMVMTESWNEPPTANNRSLITITRSGARQYGKPWGFYITSFAWGGTANSIRTEEEAYALNTPKYKCTVALDFGLAPSVFKRLQFLAYYAGTNYLMFETDLLGLAVEDKKTGKWHLTGNGLATRDFYSWYARPEGKRGEFYAPVLLLTDYYNGNWDWKRGEIWNVWYMHPFEDSDYMFQHINRSFDLFVHRGADKTSQLDKGWSLVNSKLGDIYDIFFANPPSGAVTLPELGRYPVVFLIGDIRFSNELLASLKQYVRLGGTLIINSAQDKAFFEDSEFSGVKAADDWVQDGDMKLRKLDAIKGKVFAATVSGQPLIVKNPYGQGNVIFMTPYYLLNIKNMKEPLPLIPDFLEKLQMEVCPVQVSGNIHFLFNKMGSSRWNLVLLNHRGVYKDPYRSIEEADPAYASEVSITVPPGTTAKEIRLQQPIKQDGNIFTLTVPSGEICVVALDKVSFSDKPLLTDPIIRKGGFPDVRNVNHGIHLQSDFSEKKGDVAVDSSGKENHGNIFASDYDGEALKFDGKGSFVHYHLTTLRNPVSEGTFECRVKPDSAFQNARQQIFLTNHWVKLGIINGHWNVQLYDMAKSGSLTAGKVDFDQWNHIVFTWNQQIAEFYVNGIKFVDEAGPLLHINPLENADSGADVFLGTHHYLRTALFKGWLTAVRYYGHFLSEKEVQELQ